MDAGHARQALARRYLTRSGQATVNDLQWWTGWIRPPSAERSTACLSTRSTCTTSPASRCARTIRARPMAVMHLIALSLVIIRDRW